MNLNCALLVEVMYLKVSYYAWIVYVRQGEGAKN